MRRIGLIGNGRIGSAIIEGLREDKNWLISGVLTRAAADAGLVRSFGDVGSFLGEQYDLVIDAAGPDALRRYGPHVLSRCDLWTISATALVDDVLRQALADAATKSQFRLRVLGGAMSGLDGVAALAAGGPMTLDIVNQRHGLSREAGVVFSGPLREAAQQFPDEVNAAVALALAGPGIDNVNVTLRDPGPSGDHRLSFSCQGSFGTLEVDILVQPLGKELLHPVAASILSALPR